jgi:hypothetical protein
MAKKLRGRKDREGPCGSGITNDEAAKEEDAVYLRGKFFALCLARREPAHTLRIKTLRNWSWVVLVEKKELGRGVVEQGGLDSRNGKGASPA